MFSEISKQDSGSEEKEQIWEGLSETIERSPLPVDERMKEAVIAFNAVGLPTTQSCEGHKEKEGWDVTYIDVEALNEPEYRFADTKEWAEDTKRENGITKEKEELYEKIKRDQDILAAADKALHNLPARDSKPSDEKRRLIDSSVRNATEKRINDYGFTYEEYDRVRKVMAEIEGRIFSDGVQSAESNKKREETPEYLEWRGKNEKLMEQAQQLLSEFYQDSEISPESRLGVYEYESGPFAVSAPGKKNQMEEEPRSAKEKQELEKSLPLRQKEMQEFGKFLRGKFFSE